ncbi:LysR family transcriptional regulator [Kurthia massiliensis]|uniref:LysR family transcriptional regulator n=1 Tax=Kurthia massiliensis TaxID=1033739 RepID=UPI000289F5B2|nr:LysR family transcriptional regulator [Kurthia massiliensis]
MEWHHFHYFKVLAEMEHMTRAAEKLAVSQPALSRAIMRIEEELGVTLFDRNGRSIRLNKFGELFLESTNRIVLEMETVKTRLSEMSGIETGEVTLGFLHTVGATYLSLFMKHFKETHPNVRVKLVQNNSQALKTLLSQGIIDLCMTTPVATEKNIDWQPLLTEELFVTLPKMHLLAGRSSLKVSELKEETFILLKEGFALRHLANDLLAEAGVQASISFEGEEVQTIASFVAANLGISFLPKLEHLAFDDLVQIPIEGKKAERQIGICWNKEVVETAVVREMKEQLIHYFHRFH